MKLLYVIPIVIGFGIDIIDFSRWMIAHIKQTGAPTTKFDTLSIFFLPAWGISGIMIFGKQPEKIVKIWSDFLLVLFFAFCIHLFIRIGLPMMFVIAGNLYYGRKLFDMSMLHKNNDLDD